MKIKYIQMELAGHKKQIEKTTRVTDGRHLDQLGALEDAKKDFRERVDEIDSWYKEMIA